MFKDTLEAAIPLIEKYAPTIAEALAEASVSPTPLTLGLAAIRLLAEVYKPDNDEFSMGELEQRILNHPETESCLKLAEEKILKYIQDREIK